MSTAPSVASKLASAFYKACFAECANPDVVRALIGRFPHLPTLRDTIPEAQETLKLFDRLVAANPPPVPEETDQRRRPGRRLGDSGAERRRKLSADSIRRARELCTEGMKTELIAKRFRVSAITVLKYTRDITREKRTEAAARRLITKVGVPVEEVSKQFGIPKAKLLMGIPKKKRKRKRANR